MNKINFYPSEFNPSLIFNNVTHPSPAYKEIPKWFKNIPRYQNNEKEMIVDKSVGYHNLTVRHCMPFIDSLTAGYFLTTFTDIFIRRENGLPIISYGDLDLVNKLGMPPIQFQQHFQSHIQPLPGYDNFLCAWSVYWRIKTPKNTSCIFLQPLNRTDLPFFTLSGITDTDSWNGSDVLNFAFQKDFEGVIPKGTPYAQIVPFERKEWNLEILENIDESKAAERQLVSKSRMDDIKSGYYRDNLWETKRYN